MAGAGGDYYNDEGDYDYDDENSERSFEEEWVKYRNVVNWNLDGILFREGIRKIWCLKFGERTEVAITTQWNREIFMFIFRTTKRIQFT